MAQTKAGAVRSQAEAGVKRYLIEGTVLDAASAPGTGQHQGRLTEQDD